MSQRGFCLAPATSNVYFSSVSAASQAITTYIRIHMKRCKDQQDHPLLLRLMLSGTPSDDDLLPALHSRSGGAHCTANSETRKTNFRRGTTVWYLSRATGAPCPFSRAGIRLCDYGGMAATGDLKQKNRQQCGDKRKRPLRNLRGCTVDKGSDSESTSEEKPVPKVRLTLRLKPLATLSSSPTNSTPKSSGSQPRTVIDITKDSESDDSREDSMPVDPSDDEGPPPPKKEEEPAWSLPPYPRRSISIPSYTPSYDDCYPTYFSNASGSRDYHSDFHRRSPSVPHSIASPPPDSEDEDDDDYRSKTGSRRYSSGRLRTPAATYDNDWDLEFDSEGDDNSLWESPGPRSPSAPLVLGIEAEVAVKQEPRDVQGMLDAWDDFDSSISDVNVVEVVEKAAAVLFDEELPSVNIKLEPLDTWDWESVYKTVGTSHWSTMEDEDCTKIKQEDIGFEASLVSPHDTRSMPLPIHPGPSSPLSPLSSVSSSSDISSLAYPGSPGTGQDTEYRWNDNFYGSPGEVDGDEWQLGEDRLGTLRRRAKTAPSFSFLTTSIPTPAPAPSPETTSLPSPPPLHLDLPARAPVESEPSDPMTITDPKALTALIGAMAMSSPTSISPSSLSVTPLQNISQTGPVVVNTCQPCTPAISATQLEGKRFRYVPSSNLLIHFLVRYPGISVYQMIFESSFFLRRIDTDFVHLTPIMQCFGLGSLPAPVTPNVTEIHGSAVISGVWVPLVEAQAFVREHPLHSGLLNIFLSDVLCEWFPSALQDLHKMSTPGRAFNQFGPDFASTIEAARFYPFLKPILNRSWKTAPAPALEEPAVPISSPSALDLLPTSTVDLEFKDQPLSTTEQEIFHVFCSIPDSDWDNSGTTTPCQTSKSEAPVVSAEEAESEVQCPDAVSVEVPPVKDVTPSPRTPVPERSNRPLRRSKRVADAIAARSRPRSRRRSSKAV